LARQPYLPQYKGKSSAMGADIIERMPGVAELVGRITINWTQVDLQLSLTMGSLLGVENKASVAVFLSLRNNRAKRDALEAASNVSLDKSLQDIFKKILKVHSLFDRQRNDMVHGVWGISEATPDGIIWSSLQDHANMLITDYHMEKTGTLTATSRNDNMLKDYYVIRLKDMAKLNSNIILLARLIGSFHSHLRYKGEIAGDNALKSVLSNPLLNAE
jgi:hypothetical protein